VRREIVHLAALLSRPTCRAVAEIFSRRFAQSRKMKVGRTFVNSVLRAKRYEIQVERRRMKNARPKALPRNLIWGVDLTGKTDTGGKLHFVLGLLDHGTRANMSLVGLANKSSFTLLGHLFLAIGRFGKPRALRTDNEAVFTSSLFRFALFALGIHHQRTDPGCPWQNGVSNASSAR
jgi:putative transposase